MGSDKLIRQERGSLLVNGDEKEPIDTVDSVGIMLGQVLSNYSARLDRVSPRIRDLLPLARPTSPIRE
jgi:hypothetical protein